MLVSITPSQPESHKALAVSYAPFSILELDRPWQAIASVSIQQHPKVRIILLVRFVFHPSLPPLKMFPRRKYTCSMDQKQKSHDNIHNMVARAAEGYLAPDEPMEKKHGWVRGQCKRNDIGTPK